MWYLISTSTVGRKCSCPSADDHSGWESYLSCSAQLPVHHRGTITYIHTHTHTYAHTSHTLWETYTVPCITIFVILICIVGVSAIAERSVEGVTENLPQGVQHGWDQPPCSGWNHTLPAHGGTARRGWTTAGLSCWSESIFEVIIGIWCTT